ncbi:MAG: tyrosine-type recombinase/integrase [Bacteroidaceae bacterium]|nr:tyrosine-type recombinase/integrase [Bacteroidaceae bacterium]
MSFLLLVPERQKNYDYLKPWECRLIEDALSSDRLSLRDKAIGGMAYYTGLRSSDIANLRLDDFDIENGLIVIAGQVKTGERLALPLRPVVRDAYVLSVY